MDAIRTASPADFERINEIYNWTIIDNHVSFDTEPFDLHTRAIWWEAREHELPCLVSELDGEITGISYSSRYRAKPAYRSTVETTIVLDQNHLGRGLGQDLLGSLLEHLTTLGFHMAVAIIALPNDASVALHRKLGYRSVGVLHDAGFKNGRHWDTELFERRLGNLIVDHPSTRG